MCIIIDYHVGKAVYHHCAVGAGHLPSIEEGSELLLGLDLDGRCLYRGISVEVDLVI